MHLSQEVILGIMIGNYMNISVLVLECALALDNWVMAWWISNADQILKNSKSLMSFKLKSKAQEDTATGNNVGMMLMSSCNKAYQNRVIRFFLFFYFW